MKQPTPKGKDLKYFRLYLQYLKPHKLSLLLGFAVIPVITLALLLQPILIKRGIDKDIAAGDLEALSLTGFWFGLCVILELLCRSTQSYLFQRTGIRSITTLRKDLFDHLLRQSSSWFDRTPVGKLTTRVTSDIEALNETFSSGVITLLADLFNLAGIVIVMFYLSPKLTLITLVFVPPLIFIVNVFKKHLRKYYNRIRTSVANLNAYLQEQLEGYTVVQMFSREEKNYRKFIEENQIYKRANMGSISFDSMLYSIMDAASSIIVGLVIWFSFSEIMDGSITLGLLVAFVDFVRKFFQPLRELSSKFAILQAALAALEKIFDSFSLDEQIESGSKVLHRKPSSLRFENVEFAYPGYEDKPVLKGISFELKQSEVVAIVGPTGSGKSSISKLVSHLYPAYTGNIFMGNDEIRTLDLSSLRSSVAVAAQDVEIFSNTVEYNISLGNPTVSLEDCKEAAKLVQADQFIRKLPQAYQTKLSAGGNELSAGQAQLISFARALAQNSPFIILDEATAAVDSLSEKILQDATERILKEKTVLVIAHRLSTIRHANTILAVKDGRIIEQGSHQELIAKNGFYKKLFQIQFAHL